MECAELLHEWNCKLQDAGFFDIEMQEGAKHFSLLENDIPSPQINPKAEYYSKLYEKTNQETFKNKTHETIMRKKSDGAKVVEIIRELDSSGNKIHRETVRHIIRRYEHKWGVRVWSHRQMMKARIE